MISNGVCGFFVTSPRNKVEKKKTAANGRDRNANENWTGERVRVRRQETGVGIRWLRGFEALAQAAPGEQAGEGRRGCPTSLQDAVSMFNWICPECGRDVSPVGIGKPVFERNARRPPGAPFATVDPALDRPGDV
jgi:hypothetical protein